MRPYTLTVFALLCLSVLFIACYTLTGARVVDVTYAVDDSTAVVVENIYVVDYYPYYYGWSAFNMGFSWYPYVYYPYDLWMYPRYPSVPRYYPPSYYTPRPHSRPSPAPYGRHWGDTRTRPPHVDGAPPFAPSRPPADSRSYNPREMPKSAPPAQQHAQPSGRTPVDNGRGSGSKK